MVTLCDHLVLDVARISQAFLPDVTASNLSPRDRSLLVEERVIDAAEEENPNSGYR